MTDDDLLSPEVLQNFCVAPKAEDAAACRGCWAGTDRAAAERRAQQRLSDHRRDARRPTGRHAVLTTLCLARAVRVVADGSSDDAALTRSRWRLHWWGLGPENPV